MLEKWERKPNIPIFQHSNIFAYLRLMGIYYFQKRSTNSYARKMNAFAQKTKSCLWHCKLPLNVIIFVPLHFIPDKNENKSMFFRVLDATSLHQHPRFFPRSTLPCNCRIFYKRFHNLQRQGGHSHQHKPKQLFSKLVHQWNIIGFYVKFYYRISCAGSQTNNADCL